MCAQISLVGVVCVRVCARARPKLCAEQGRAADRWPARVGAKSVPAASRRMTSINHLHVC